MRLSLCALPLVAAMSLPIKASANEPFAACPSEAFIVQTPGASPVLYGVDLAIGSYFTLSSDMGTSKVNGAGFSFHDNYVYGWDYGAGTLAQFGADYQARPLDLVNLIDQPFFVGDVSVLDNAWFGYRRGFGLYKVDLSNPDSRLQMEQVASHTVMGNPNLTDFAFHPYDGQIYALDNDGFLLSIDPLTGTTVVLKQVLNEAAEGFNFTFGAQYFDADENLYVSNNSNGYIYRVTLNGGLSEAVFFAYGPSSSSNDGARCALAPVEAGEKIDFGDAPDSYGTSLDNSGARHGVSSLYLGATVDAEADAFVFPLADDSSDGTNDDDGVVFPTGLEIGESAIVVANLTGSDAYLNAWVDWNQDGRFGADEVIADGVSVSEGSNTLAVDVPIWATLGETWARFRVSSTVSIGPTGGVSDGEVEDYQLNVTETGVTARHYPGSNSLTSFAFEDLFPALGDFDMNDVLMNVRFTEYVKNNQVIRMKIEGQLAALGGEYHNGFAIGLPGISSNMILEEGVVLTINQVEQSGSVVEPSDTHAVLIVSPDLWTMAPPRDGQCRLFRVEDGCGTTSRPSWSMTIPLRAPISEARMPAMPYDPFIFASPGRFRESYVTAITGENPGRRLEIHLKNRAPTNVFASGLLGAYDDASNVRAGSYYQTESGIPWALEIPIDWKHPKEGESLLDAYPQFFDFARDPSGNTNRQWYLESNADQTFLHKG